MSALDTLVAGAAQGALVAWKAIAVALVHGSALALVAWAIARALGRRARPALIAALWSIVLVKFALPVGPAMPWSLSDALAHLGGAAPAAAAAPDLAPGGVAAPAAVAGPGALAYLALAGLALWLAGVAVVALRGVGHARRARATALALPPVDAVTLAVACGIAERLGLARTPELRLAPEGAGAGAAPWLVGLRRPVVVVPAALAARGRRGELTAALTHELAHLRRRDVWLRLLQVAVGALFFFWPVVRWVNRRIDAAREMACDAWAVAEGPLAPAEYARMLVGMAVIAAPAPRAAMGLAATPGLLRGRVDAVLSGGRRGAALGKLGAAGLAAWTVVALGGARSSASVGAAARLCHYSQSMADALYLAHPEADLDGDGTLSRDEACGFERAAWRRRLDEAVVARSEPEAFEAALAVAPADSPFGGDHLCCNCTEDGSTSSRLDQPESAAKPALEPANTCVRGVTP